MLEQERRYYEDNLDAWLNLYAGRVVLVKEDRLVGVYDTLDEALGEGARQFGLQSFLVRRVLPEQEEIQVPALTLGLLNANSTRTIFGGGPDAIGDGRSDSGA